MCCGVRVVCVVCVMCVTCCVYMMRVYDMVCVLYGMCT